MRSTLPFSVVTRTSRTASCIGLRRLLAWREGRKPMRSDRMLLPGATLSSFCGIELSPPGIIVIAEIEHISGARLDRHLPGCGDIVDIGCADRGIDRTV